MNRFLFALGLALGLAACAPTQSPPLEHPSLAGDLGLRTPDGWVARDYSENSRTVLQWTAPRDEDARGARVLVVRVEDSPIARASLDDLGRWLLDTQQKLPQPRFGAPITFVTASGFQGVRVEGEFVPFNRRVAYRRLHAVIVDGTALVHVIYTARQIDRENFDAIVGSFARDGE